MTKNLTRLLGPEEIELVLKEVWRAVGVQRTGGDFCPAAAMVNGAYYGPGDSKWVSYPPGSDGQRTERLASLEM